MEKKPKIHLNLFNIFSINYVTDQVEFILAIFKQNGYKVSVGNYFKDDALNILIECFDVDNGEDFPKTKYIIEYCQKNNKKIAVVMTEHIDFFNKKIYAYSLPIDNIDKKHYNPCIKNRIISLMALSPYIRHYFTLGEFPKLKNFRELIGKTPIIIPYPKLKEIYKKNDLCADLIFSGKNTPYRSQILKQIQDLCFSLVNNSYDKILTRKKRNELISKAKVNLNIPQDENWLYPSTLRIILGLSLGKITISIDNFGSEECNGNFYARVNKNNLEEMRTYLEQYDIYYKKFLKSYNDEAVKGVFPNDYFKIWAKIEEVI